MTSDDLLSRIDAAFGAAPRPPHFADPAHCRQCDECNGHDALLRSRDRASLAIDDIADPASDPLVVCPPPGLAYFMPRLARLALETRDDRGQLRVVGQFASHLWSGGRYNQHLRAFDAAQRDAVVALMEFLLNDRADAIEADVETVLQVHDYWSSGPVE